MRMLCFHCLLKISEPTLPGVLKQALRCAIFTRQDQNIKKITSLQKKIFAFLRKRDTFACLPTGYGKSLIFRLTDNVATINQTTAGQYYYMIIKGISFNRTFRVISLCLSLYSLSKIENTSFFRIFGAVFFKRLFYSSKFVICLCSSHKSDYYFIFLRSLC